MKEWMELFNLEDAKRVVLGDKDYLMTAFCWEDTKQGEVYWFEIYKGVKPFNKKARKRVLNMIIEYVRENG